MEQVIRKNTFETNSSSLHSIAICRRDPSNVEKLKEFKADISGGEYGWDQEEYCDPIGILEYLWTYVALYRPVYIDKLTEYLPNVVFRLKDITVEGECRWSDYAYIDHGYMWDGEIDQIFEDKELFADLLFDGRIATWNDNTDTSTDEEWLNPHEAVLLYHKEN